MANFLQLQQRTRNLKPQKVRNELFKFIRSIESELALYNRAQLNLDSTDVKGQPIGFYSKGTEIITKGRKKEGQPFDLFETGKFLGGLFAKVQGKIVVFGTTDGKEEKVLANLYTQDIFGLDKNSLNRVVEDKLIPYFQDYYREKLLE